MMVGGVARQFLVHAPAAGTRVRAIVVVLHGGSGSGAQASNFAISPQAVFRRIADREGVVAVFPTALSSNWNDCRGDAPGITGTGDDVAFFDALLARLGGDYALDSTRMFMTGTSNGAMMSMRYAYERPERIGAIATSSGNLPAVPKAGVCTTGPSRATPILMSHGTTDPLVLYGGGCVAQPIFGDCRQGTVIGAEATRDRWLQINSRVGVVPTVSQTEVTPDDGGPAVRHVYSGATPVEWWRLDGAGHSPPSTSVFLDRGNSGIQNRDVEFAEIAWSFFAARLPS